MKVAIEYDSEKQVVTNIEAQGDVKSGQMTLNILHEAMEILKFNLQAQRMQAYQEAALQQARDQELARRINGLRN